MKTRKKKSGVEMWKGQGTKSGAGEEQVHDVVHWKLKLKVLTHNKMLEY